MTWSETEPLDAEWVMVGYIRRPGWVTLLASQHMTRAELEIIEDDGGMWPSFADALSGIHYVLSAELDQFVLIEAPDWPTAFRHLFERWGPGGQARPSVGQPAQIEERRPR